MEDNIIYPVGSIIKFKSAVCLIVGYLTEGKKKGEKVSYILLPYPSGYVDADSFAQIPCDEVELISEGYKNELSDAYIEYIKTFNIALEKYSSDEITEEMKKRFNNYG